MRSRAWLLAAVVLLAVAAWLMARGDAKEKPAKPAAVAFPRHQGREEQERSRRRRTLPPPPPKPNEDFIRPNRDPLHVALPTKKGKSAVVFEASALRESPLGKLWLDCMLSRYDLERLEQMKEEIGIDILNDVERVAVSSEKVVIATGEFAGVNLKELSSTSRAYGAKGVIYEGEERGRTFAVWDRSVILMGPDVSALEASIDRLEDKVPPEAPLIPEWASYGEVYGVLSAEDIAQILPESERAMAEQLRGAVEQVELHVDASEDVAIVADVEGPLEGEVDDLAKTLGAALSLGRLKAQADKDDKLVELLELARVSPRGGRFSVEMALPLSLIQRQMGPCRKDRDRDRDADPGDLGARDGG